MALAGLLANRCFDVSPRNLGIAMESYFGGRAETRVRAEELPVVPVDFTSEYPSTCALLKLWQIVTAEDISFDDATESVRKQLQQITHEKMVGCCSRYSKNP
jgi:hypothetical protein